MKAIQYAESNSHKTRKNPFAWKLMTALALCLCGMAAFSSAYAQATNSSIIGKAPEGVTIAAHSDTGIGRHGTANGKGRYTLSSLPPGVYTVTLQKDGNTLATQSNVPLFAGKAVEVDFDCANDQCTASFGH
jgi:hypothetical protein